MKRYDRIFDLLVEISDQCHEDGLTVTSKRIEQALDALLAETGRLPAQMANIPMEQQSPTAVWRRQREGARQRAVERGAA